MSKRQYTKTMLSQHGSKGTFIRVSLIRRKAKGRKFDVIQMEHLSLGDKKPYAYNCTPQEALEIATGLTWAVRQFMMEFKPYDAWEDSLDKKR